jgi:hypothetical protein
MLNALRNWGRNQLNSIRTRPSDDSASHQHTNLNREQRAELVARLRNDINRLQHEISDLNDTMPTDGATASGAQTSEMADLHRQLTKTQHELSKYQARI